MFFNFGRVDGVQGGLAQYNESRYVDAWRYSS